VDFLCDNLFISDILIVMFFDDIFLCLCSFILLVMSRLLCSLDDLCSRAFICLVCFVDRFSLLLFIDFVLLVDGLYIDGIFLPCGWICFKK